jgi:hypothetical protein
MQLTVSDYHYAADLETLINPLGCPSWAVAKLANITTIDNLLKKPAEDSPLLKELLADFLQLPLGQLVVTESSRLLETFLGSHCSWLTTEPLQPLDHGLHREFKSPDADFDTSLYLVHTGTNFNLEEKIRINPLAKRIVVDESLLFWHPQRLIVSLSNQPRLLTQLAAQGIELCILYNLSIVFACPGLGYPACGLMFSDTSLPVTPISTIANDFLIATLSQPDDLAVYLSNSLTIVRHMRADFAQALETLGFTVESTDHMLQPLYVLLVGDDLSNLCLVANSMNIKTRVVSGTRLRLAVNLEWRELVTALTILPAIGK